MENELNQIAIVNDEEGKLLGLLTSRTASYCSVKPTTDDQKTALFNATNTPTGRLADMINLNICVTDVYMEVVTCVDQATGKETKVPRIVFLCSNGESYQAASKGILQATAKLFQAFGEPTWAVPIIIQPYQITRSVGGQTHNVLSFRVLGRHQEEVKAKK